MTLTFTLMWWHVPAAVTLLGFLWLILPTPRGGYGQDIAALIECVIWLAGSMIVWIIAGALK